MLFTMDPPWMRPFRLDSQLAIFALLIFLFYSNMYWLVPRFLLHGKYLYYGLGIAVYIAIALLLIRIFQIRSEDYFTGINEGDGYKPEMIIRFLFILLVLVGATTAIKLFQRWISDARRINELERITMQAELEQLKNQINPHFLFNMLNNANVLTQRDPQKASQVLMKLSDFLRYQIYDCARPQVLLTADIHFLTDFLNLEKIRRDNFEFIISKEGQLTGVQIAPLLFITFVENAVKHNMDASSGSYVNLYFEVKNNELLFKCVNSKPLIASKKAVGGLGLENVKRRLQLLYPLTHQLDIDDQTDTFTVTLKITL